jgi:hypothetical protein
MPHGNKCTEAGPAAALHPQGRPDRRRAERLDDLVVFRAGRPSRSASSASAPHDFAAPWPSYAAGTAATWSRSSSCWGTARFRPPNTTGFGTEDRHRRQRWTSGCKVWAIPQRDGGRSLRSHMRPLGRGGLRISLTLNNKSNIITIILLKHPRRGAHGHQS